MLGWGGIGGVIGLAIDLALEFAGSIVMAKSDGLGGCVSVPSRRMSP